MELQPILTTTTRTDVSGQWEADGGEGIAPGYHRIFVTDEEGMQTEAPLFVEGGETLLVVRDRPQWIDRLEVALPPGYAYVLLVLGFLLAATTLLLLWFGYRAERRFPGGGRSFVRIALAVVALVLTGSVLTALGMRYWPASAPRGLADPFRPAVEERYVEAKGRVVAPFVATPIAGVDLTVGNTSVRTWATGQFIFSRAKLGEPVRVTHPDLRRAVGWVVTSEAPMEVVFDVGMYNLLHEVLDAEAGGKRADLFARLGTPEQGSVTREVFEAQPAFYRPVHRAAQVMRVTGVQVESRWESPQSKAIWSMVALVRVEEDGKSHIFAFTRQQDGWKLAY